MPLYDVRCENGHEAEAWAKFDERDVPCGLCGAPTVRLWRAHAVIGDDIPGGFVQEHFGHQPETFYSKKAMLHRANELGLQPMVRHVEGDKHVSSWATMDQYTLDAAKALVSRAGALAKPEPDVPCETFRWFAEVKE